MLSTLFSRSGVHLASSHLRICPRVPTTRREGWVVGDRVLSATPVHWLGQRTVNTYPSGVLSLPLTFCDVHSMTEYGGSFDRRESWVQVQNAPLTGAF